MTWRTIHVLLILAVTSGCNGPFLQFPGGRLSGPEAALTAGVAPQEDGVVIELETRPADPYSVHVGCVVIEGRVYVDPADERRWYRHIRDDRRVRVRFDGDPVVYSAYARDETDPHVLERFDPQRHVLRLDPRDATDAP